MTVCALSFIDPYRVRDWLQGLMNVLSRARPHSPSSVTQLNGQISVLLFLISDLLQKSLKTIEKDKNMDIYTGCRVDRQARCSSLDRAAYMVISLNIIWTKTGTFKFCLNQQSTPCA